MALSKTGCQRSECGQKIESLIISVITWIYILLRSNCITRYIGEKIGLHGNFRDENFAGDCLAARASLTHFSKEPSIQFDERELVYARAILPHLQFCISQLWGYASPYLGMPPFNGLLGGFYMLGIRVKLIEGFFEREIADETKQVIIMGAGYDMTAYRRSELCKRKSVRVFEVDRPAIQKRKRENLAKKLGLEYLDQTSNVIYVQCDFESTTTTNPTISNATTSIPGGSSSSSSSMFRSQTRSVGEQLRNGGVDMKLKTAIIMEGVTPYVAYDSFIQTITSLKGSVPSGTKLICDIINKERTSEYLLNYFSKMQKICGTANSPKYMYTEELLENLERKCNVKIGERINFKNQAEKLIQKPLHQKTLELMDSIECLTIIL